MNALSVEFAQPYALLLLAGIPALVFWHYQRRQAHVAPLRLSSTQSFDASPSLRVQLRPLLPFLQLMALTLLVLALARPRKVFEKENINVNGIDIVLALDISPSMLARDFEPNRLGVSKKVAEDFVNNRPYDRIGLVVFAGESFTQCPLTTDHQVVKTFLQELQVGLLSEGTAIGSGLATASKRLEKSDVASKIIILLTDGENTAGDILPMYAAELAEKLGLKVYTIGVGSKGQARTPTGFNPDGSYSYGWKLVNIDEPLLTAIAEQTGGQYFRAKDEEELERIYETIDKLERTKMETTTIRNYQERYHILVFAAFILLFFYGLLANTIFKTIV